jgi:hypothetical protein
LGIVPAVILRRALIGVAVLAGLPLLGGCLLIPQPLPPAAAAAVTTACNNLETAVQPFGVKPAVLKATCGAAVDGTESDLLRTFLASPQLGCIALAGPITALLPPVATACQQFATAIQPYSSLLGGALTPPT